MSHPGRGTVATQHKGDELGMDAPRITVEKSATSMEEEVERPQIFVIETSQKETTATRSEERTSFASTKKQKLLQNAVHHSTDSDPDGDIHLIIDEGQGDTVGASMPVTSASAATSSSLPSPSLLSTTAGGGGGTEDKDGQAEEAVKKEEEEYEEEEDSGGSKGKCSFF